MIVRNQKKITFVNDAGCSVDVQELERAILWYTNRPVVSVKKIFMHGNYPAISIHGEKIHVHRLLMAYWAGRKLATKEFVHHLNENKLCALKSNLSVMIDTEHQSLHNKGKRFTQEHKQKISDAGKRRTGLKFKKRRSIPLDELKDMINKGCSINKISGHFNVDWSTIRNRINENPELLEG